MRATQLMVEKPAGFCHVLDNATDLELPNHSLAVRQCSFQCAERQNAKHATGTLTHPLRMAKADALRFLSTANTI